MNLAHAHLLLNHIPVIGMAGSILILFYGLARRSDEITRLALKVLVLVAVFAMPAYFTGEPAEEVVEHLPGVEEPAIESHEEAGLVALGASGLAGLAALAGLLLGRGGSPKARPLAVVALLLSLTAGGLLAWTATLGGRIRHPEARPGFEAVRSAVGTDVEDAERR